MASSSGSWFLILILLAVGAVLLVSANEANYGYLKAGKDLKVEGGKIITDIVDRFSKSDTINSESNNSNSNPSRVPKQTSARARAKIPISDDQQDKLATRDRAELGELLDKVGQ